MIRAFLDESEQGDILLVAGWVADYKTWEHFSDEWRTVLDADPKIEYFRHHEAKGEPPSGQFMGWTAQQVDAKITKLIDVVCAHEMYGVSSGLNVRTHQAAFSGAVVSRKQLRSTLKISHPFHSCVFSANALVLQIQVDKKQTDRRVDFVFDEMTGMLEECITLYRELKPLFPEAKRAIAGTMTQADDKQVEALQAADLLAGQLTRSLRFGQSEEHYRRMWRAHDILVSLAYFPSFDKIPDLVHAFNVFWSTLQLSRITEKRGSGPQEVL